MLMFTKGIFFGDTWQSTYLFIYRCDNGRPYIYAQHKAQLKIVLKGDRLDKGHGEQEDGIDISNPHIAVTVICEGDQKSARAKPSDSHQAFTGSSTSSCMARAPTPPCE